MDFADVKTVMENTGLAHMGVGRATGENRAEEAAKQAISSPLLETSIVGATGVLLNVTGGMDLGLLEINDAAKIVQDAADPDANIIFGAVIDEDLQDEIRITVIATGFDQDRIKKKETIISKKSDEKSSNDISIEEVAATNDYSIPDLEIPPFLRRHNK